MSLPGPKTTLTLQRRTEVRDSAGSYTTTWATVGTIKGVFYASGGDELVEHEKKTVRVTHGFICERQSTAMTPTESDRMLYGSQTYEIVFVDEVQLHHLELRMVARTY